MQFFIPKNARWAASDKSTRKTLGSTIMAKCTHTPGSCSRTVCSFPPARTKIACKIEPPVDAVIFGIKLIKVGPAIVPP